MSTIPLTGSERHILTLLSDELSRVRAELAAIPTKSLLAPYDASSARVTALGGAAGALAWAVYQRCLASECEALRIAAGAPTIADIDPEGDSRDAAEDERELERETHEERVRVQTDCAAHPAGMADRAATLLRDLGISDV